MRRGFKSPTGWAEPHIFEQLSRGIPIRQALKRMAHGESGLKPTLELGLRGLGWGMGI
jgi:hypothetical protein